MKVNIHEGLTEEQLEAVLSPEKRLMVRAAAGSGKTRVLVHRYLHFVVDLGIPPSAILAVTFTVKAAAEMRIRIVQALDSLGLGELAREAETAQIQTTDSIYDRLLRENCVEAGIDPKFTMMESSQVDQLITEFLEEILSTDFNNLGWIATFARNFAGVQMYRKSARLRTKIRDAAHDLIAKIRGSDVSLEALRAAYANPESVMEYFDLKVGELGFDSKPNRPTNITSTQEEALQYACGLVQLALDVVERLHETFLARQSFDYEFTRLMTERLVLRSEFAVAQMRKKFRVLMVDEAQDFNASQYRIFDALDLDYAFYVGDVQQSIYRFRNADVRLFEKKATECHLLRLSTNFRSDRRILQAVDEVFRPLWRDRYLPMEPRPDADRGSAVLWESKAKNFRKVAERVAAMIESNTARAGDIAILTSSSNDSANMCDLLREEGVPYRFENVKRMLELDAPRDLISILEALSRVGGNLEFASVLRSELVGLSLDSIVLLLADAKAKQCSLRELCLSLPEIGGEDGAKLNLFCDWFTVLSQYADRLSAWEVISRLLDSTRFLEALAAGPDPHQALANIRKLHSMAMAQPSMRAQDYARQLRELADENSALEEAMAFDENENSVFVVNIHRVKGLEFPIVILPDTYRKRELSNSIELIFDRSTGLLSFKNDPHWNLMLQREKELERGEIHRLLYVAATRARKQLIISVGEEGIWGRAIRNAQKVSDPEAAVFDVVTPEYNSL